MNAADILRTLRDLLTEEPRLLGTYTFSNGLETDAIHNAEQDFPEKPEARNGLEIVVIPGSSLERTDYLGDDCQVDTIYTVQFRQFDSSQSTHAATQRVITRLRDWTIEFGTLRPRSSAVGAIEQIDAKVTDTGMYFGTTG